MGLKNLPSCRVPFLGVLILQASSTDSRWRRQGFQIRVPSPGNCHHAEPQGPIPESMSEDSRWSPHLIQKLNQGHETLWGQLQKLCIKLVWGGCSNLNLPQILPGDCLSSNQCSRRYQSCLTSSSCASEDPKCAVAIFCWITCHSSWASFTGSYFPTQGEELESSRGPI